VILVLNRSEQNPAEQSIIGFNIPFFQNHTFNEVYKVHCKGKHEKFYSELYQTIHCDTIATDWLNKKQYSYSYLTNPNNIKNKFYYAIKCQTYKFNMTVANGLLAYIEINKLSEFLNSFSELLKSDIQTNKIRRKISFRYSCCMAWSIIFLLILLTSWVFAFMFFYPYIFFNYIFYPWPILIGLFLLSFYFPRRHKQEYKISYHYLLNTARIEQFVNSWNVEYFIPNGVYVTCPRNLKYIQFTIGLNRLMIIDRHEFPFMF
jgi:hypothetical protein